MKIFVTVGHTHYDALFQAVDEQLSPENYQVINQISDGSYFPKRHKYFRHTSQENVKNEIASADLVITHAGAGSVFYLLEIAKPVLIVPNFDRIDNHQKDIAEFVKQNNYANVCDDLAQLEKFVIETFERNFSQYEKNSFYGYQEILDAINQS